MATTLEMQRTIEAEVARAESVREACEATLRIANLQDRERARLIPGYDRAKHDWKDVALAVYEVLGVTPAHYNHTLWPDELRMTRAAADAVYGRKRKAQSAKGAKTTNAKRPADYPTLKRRWKELKAESPNEKVGVCDRMVAEQFKVSIRTVSRARKQIE